MNSSYRAYVAIDGTLHVEEFRILSRTQRSFVIQERTVRPLGPTDAPWAAWSNEATNPPSLWSAPEKIERWSFLVGEETPSIAIEDLRARTSKRRADALDALHETNRILDALDATSAEYIRERIIALASK